MNFFFISFQYTFRGLQFNVGRSPGGFREGLLSFETERPVFLHLRESRGGSTRLDSSGLVVLGRKIGRSVSRE